MKDPPIRYSPGSFRFVISFWMALNFTGNVAVWHRMLRKKETRQKEEGGRKQKEGRIKEGRMKNVE